MSAPISCSKRPCTVIALTEPGLVLGKHLQAVMNSQQLSQSCDLLFKPKPFAETVQQRFQAGHILLMVCATGIVVRTLAPVLASKYKDPAVLVLDEASRFVIPLLSGHEGGANHLAAVLSDALDAQMVQTTAQPYTEPVYTLGLGCERDCPQSFVDELIEEAFQQTGVGWGDIHSINSIRLKADETSFLQLAGQQDLAFHTYTSEQLLTVDHLLSQRSDYIYKTVGVYGVAESAALFAAGEVTGHSAELVLNKIKNTKATCAIARSYFLHFSQGIGSL